MTTSEKDWAEVDVAFRSRGGEEFDRVRRWSPWFAHFTLNLAELIT